jgi:hypothetical protein
MLPQNRAISGRAVNKSKAKREITLTIGIFFDGTGNNAPNTERALRSCGAGYHDLNFSGAESMLANCVRDHFGFSGSEAVSYNTYFTNIYWLSTLYQQGLTTEADEAQSAVYIEGIGTEIDQPDNLVGLGLGLAETGIIAKTDKAVSKIARHVQDMLHVFQNQQQDCVFVVTTVRFDLFGFSRGGAAARHFANRVHARDSEIIKAINQGMAHSTCVGTPVVKNRFIGLFDTVAAVGIPTHHLNRQVTDTRDVNLSLATRVAERVFQIAAAHECRFNFALNSVGPDWPELLLPGAHSDIGGGYLPVVTENVFLSRPETETVPFDRPDVQTRVYQKAFAQLSILTASPAMAALARANNISAETWYDDRMPLDRYGQMQKRSFAALTLRNRVVKNRWSTVALRVMRDAALEAGVRFNAIDPTLPETALPDELVSLSAKAVVMGKAVRQGQSSQAFSLQEMDMLATKYIHCSAHWNAIDTDADGRILGGAFPSELIGFISRPDEQWRRTVYHMDARRR